MFITTIPLSLNRHTEMTDDDAAAKLKYKMSRIKGKDTQPEIIVRSLLHRAGFRFRKNVADLPGKPDIVLPKYKTIIFVHGCFWHQHPGCSKCKIPKSKVEFWTEKLGKNVQRDIRHKADLDNLGWKVLYVWECELRNRDALVERLVQSIRGA